jgi:hypothetical protein
MLFGKLILSQSTRIAPISIAGKNSLNNLLKTQTKNQLNRQTKKTNKTINPQYRQTIQKLKLNTKKQIQKKVNQGYLIINEIANNFSPDRSVVKNQLLLFFEII